MMINHIRYRMKKISVCIVLGLLTLSACAQKYPDQRPAPQDRLFVSQAVEAKIAEVAPQLTNPKPYVCVHR